MVFFDWAITQKKVIKLWKPQNLTYYSMSLPLAYLDRIQDIVLWTKEMGQSVVHQRWDTLVMG
jgi:hypothetical protein